MPAFEEMTNKVTSQIQVSDNAILTLHFIRRVNLFSPRFEVFEIKMKSPLD